jgi:ATP-dependent Lon protease
MLTSLASVFTQRKVRPHLAMTGEITLRGKVLPIGGVKEKILAAKRAGITDILLCEANRKDVMEIKADYLKELNFHYVKEMHEVIDFALLPEKVANPLSLQVETPEAKTNK